MAPKKAARKASGSGDPVDEAGAFTDLTHTLAKPSSSHDRDQARKAKKLCVFAYDHLHAGVRSMVMEAGMRPMMFFYSCDGTPIRTTVKESASVGPLKFKREGKQTTEYLAQVCFARYADTAARTNSKCLFSPPIPLTGDKSAAVQFQAGVDMGVSLRAMGHRGIIVQQYCFDRAIEHAMARMFKQLHILQAPRYGETKAESEYLQNCEWVESCGCGLHDAHNSLKWGMHFKSLGPDVLKRVFKVFRAVRNSYDLILKFLPGWIIQTVVWTPAARCPSPQHQEKVWSMLGVSAELARIIAFDLKMHWDYKDKVLRIDDTWQTRDDAMSEISGALLGVYHFRPFSDSRWVTIGCNCRTLVASLMLGLHSLVDEIRSGACSDYDIGQWDCLGKDERRFIAMSSIVSYVSDCACSKLFEDHRVARIAPDVKREMQEELMWLETQQDYIWDSVVSIFGEGEMTASRLKSDIIAGAHISASYFYMKCLSQAAEYPWCLARGDQDKKLSALKEGPQPDQPTAAKIWWLLQRGMSRHQLKAGLDLLLDAPWATAATEQGHAMGALVKRMHHEIGQHSLVARAMVYGFTKLMPTLTQEEKLVAKLKGDLAKLEKKNPDKVHAKQMFFADMMQLSNEWQRAGRMKQGADRAKKIMKQHDSWFAKLSDWQREGYEHQAAVKSSKSHKELVEAKWSLRDKIRLEQDRAEEAKKGRHPLTLTACKLQPRQMEQMGRDWQEWSVSHADAERRIKSFCAAPTVDNKLQADLNEIEVAERCLIRNPNVARPWWLVYVVKHRYQFQNTVWAVHGDTTTYHKFLFAMQSPHWVVFSPLVPKVVPAAAAPLGSGSASGAMPARQTEWGSSVMRFADWSQLSLKKDTSISVYAAARHIGEFKVVTDQEPVRMQMFLDGLPEIVVKEPEEKKAKTDGGSLTISPAILAKFPWMTADAQPSKSRRSATAGAKAEAEADAEVDVLDDDTPAGLDDDDIGKLFSALEMKRAEWEHHERDKGSVLAFKLHFGKGDWTLAHKGKHWDSAKGYAADKDTEQWCKDYKMFMSASFDTGLYGDDEATIFAQAWCSRMNYFSLWLSQADSTYKFTPPDVEGWVPAPAFLKARANCTAAQLKKLGDRFTKVPAR